MTGPVDYGVNDGGIQDQGGGNPAWNEVLEAIPQEYHEKVTPYFEKWDKGVQDRFTKVQQDYKPWEEFRKAGIDPEQARFGLNLLNAIENDPRMVYNAIGEYHKFNDPTANPSQGQNKPNEQPDDDPYAARFAQLENQNKIMGNILIKQREAELHAQEDAKLDQELKGLAKKYGEYNEQFVLAMMQNGMAAEDAVKHYFTWREQEMQQYRPKPLIMGGNGGLVPGQNTDVRKLSDAGTKNLVVQMLEAAQAQSR